MKKVLITVNNNKISGIEMFSILLAKNLDKSKFDVTIGIPVEGPIIETLKSIGLKYFVFNNKSTGRHSYNGLKNLYKNIKKNKYDIIHAQAGIAPCVIGKLTRTSLLIEHKHGLDFTEEEIFNMSFGKLIYEKLKKYLSDFTVTVCKADKNVLINKFGFKNNKVIVVYNGIEKSDISKNENTTDGKVVGTIGRLTYQKGQEFLIESASEILKMGYKFEFHIYGDGENQQKYKELIEQYGIQDQVKLKGYTTDAKSVLKTFDLFVLPSRYEGIPYVILEAMSMKIPVISTNVGGINEVIINRENGLLIKKENVSELSEGIVFMMDNDAFRNEMSDKAYLNFEQNFTIAKTVEKIESIYNYCI